MRGRFLNARALWPEDTSGLESPSLRLRVSAALRLSALTRTVAFRRNDAMAQRRRWNTESPGLYFCDLSVPMLLRFRVVASPHHCVPAPSRLCVFTFPHPRLLLAHSADNRKAPRHRRALFLRRDWDSPEGIPVGEPRVPMLSQALNQYGKAPRHRRALFLRRDWDSPEGIPVGEPRIPN